MPREYKKVALHKSGRVDPDNTVVICEARDCHNEVLMGASYSFLVVFATTGPNPIHAFQCEEEQHFACSPDCAEKAAIDCIHHLRELHIAKMYELTRTRVTEVGKPEELN